MNKPKFIIPAYPSNPRVIIQSAPNTMIEISARIDTDKLTRPTSRLTYRKEYTYTGTTKQEGQTEYSYRLMVHMEDPAARWTGEAQAIMHHGEAAVKKAYRLLDEKRREEQRRIKAGRKHPAYPAMLKIVKKELTGYHADFYFHDIRTMAEHPGTPFLWVMKKRAGTFIILPPTDKPADYNRHLIQYCTHPKNGEHYKNAYLYRPRHGFSKIYQRLNPKHPHTERARFWTNSLKKAGK